MQMYSLNASKSEIDFLNSNRKDLYELLFSARREVEKSKGIRFNDLLKNTPVKGFDFELGITPYAFMVEWYSDGGRDILNLIDGLSYYIVAITADNIRNVFGVFVESHYFEWLIRLYSEEECRNFSGWDTFIETLSGEWKNFLHESFVSFFYRLAEEYTRLEPEIQSDDNCNFTLNDVYDFLKQDKRALFNGLTFEQFRDKVITKEIHTYNGRNRCITFRYYIIHVISKTQPDEWINDYCDQLNKAKSDLTKHPDKRMKSHFFPKK